ncbi:MAG: hypothetical protein F4Y80_02760 [Caldilineaceae bacterium SB0665_bin_21]|nr:hypothetical protein [Caldilineaceae bacterium SB0665_bin_21]MYA05646.1 hypothetical protein [Caldilineaceae bacterium SB0664_bin_22]
MQPEVRDPLWHLVERWHDLVRSQGNPKVSASTNRLKGWSGTLWARFKTRARLTRGLKTENRHPQLRAPDGPQHGLNRCAEPHLWRGCP